MAADPEPSIEVVYARPDRQRVVVLALRPGMTAAEAVEAADLAREFPEIAARPLELGIFGQRIDPARVVRDGDRVEVYRPLPEDPKDRRRRSAAAVGTAGKSRVR